MRDKRNSFNVQAYIDPRIFAGLLRYMVENNIYREGSQSDTTRQMLELLHANIPEENQFESVEDAITYLDAFRLIGRQMRDKRGETLQRQLKREELASLPNETKMRTNSILAILKKGEEEDV